MLIPVSPAPDALSDTGQMVTWWINRWMDEWMDRLVNEWMDRGMNGWVDEQMDRWTKEGQIGTPGLLERFGDARCQLGLRKQNRKCWTRCLLPSLTPGSRSSSLCYISWVLN